MPALFAAVVESVGDATIDHRVRQGAWTIAAGGASMSFTIDPSKDYTVDAIRSPTSTNWARLAAPDVIVTSDGTRHLLGSRNDGFRYMGVSTNNTGRRLQLDAAFLLQPQNLLVIRHVAVVSGSPTFELWTTFQAMDGSVSVTDIDAFQSLVASGTIHWITGQQSFADDPSLDSAFARRQQTLDVGQTLELGSSGRSSEVTVPWLAIDGANDELYMGLMWSGAWSLKASRTNAGLALDWGLPGMTTIVGTVPVDGPHALVGLVRGSLPEASMAMRSYIVDGIRDGRPLEPLVTYNTWFAYGTRVDDTSIRREMTHVAAMGVELFVVDAGWYAGADTKDTTDFHAGLGTWTADPDRFPDGLSSLTDYAHSLGMKFGLWVEPERIALSEVGQNGLDEPSLAMAGGSYRSSTDTALVCLAGKAGRQWVLDRVTALIDSVRPDYLKWDNNLWLNCDREGHGHGASDGNFAHVTALYEILATLRARYPSMTIENCSGGGNRLDFGMLRYTDVGWMDDHTAPSVKVRHNFDGLSAILPPGYLLSFVTNLGWEPLHNAPDLSLYLRSRMQGVLGLCFQSAWINQQDRDAIAAEVALYKAIRPTLAAASASLLTPQADADNPPDWDVLQETSIDGSVLVYAFENENGARFTTAAPTALRSDAIYHVVSVDMGPLGDATGADLMMQGIRIVRSPTSAAHILSLIPQQ